MVRRLVRRLSVPLWWPVKTRINVFVLTCSSVSSWVDADSAVDKREALAKLLKGRTGHAPGVSSNVGSYEYSRFSLPDSVVDASPRIDILPAEAKNISPGASVTDAATAGGSRCDSGKSEGNLVATTIRDCCAVRDRTLVLSVKR